ncbi:head-tail adaptor protein [Phascolarctobacterium succinatutens]|uniref:head-tail adaptor protein n=1 Tax=Phascolarctobacterium succinatutens TaxID=626940 RepID=UPI003CFEFE17
MKVSRLRHRVALLKPIRAPDEYGGARVVYEEVASVWSDFLRPNFGHQNLQGDGDVLVISQGIRLRKTTVERGWRVQQGDRLFDVLDVDESVTGETILTTQEVER